MCFKGSEEYSVLNAFFQINISVPFGKLIIQNYSVYTLGGSQCYSELSCYFCAHLYELPIFMQIMDS